MAEEKKHKKPFEHKKQEESSDDSRLIVRIANIDLNGKLSIERGLTKIKGIGLRASKNIAITFEKETGTSRSQKLGKLTEEEIKKIEQLVLHPEKSGIPQWAFNRQKDLVTGNNMHLVMADLDFSKRNDFQRLSEIKSYKGLRHIWGLTVRGQRTKSTHRGKGKVVGVTKKDVKKDVKKDAKK